MLGGGLVSCTSLQQHSTRVYTTVAPGVSLGFAWFSFVVICFRGMFGNFLGIQRNNMDDSAPHHDDEVLIPVFETRSRSPRRREEEEKEEEDAEEDETDEDAGGGRRERSRMEGEEC